MARQFGGDWTQNKLDIVEAYLKRYLIALKNQDFRLGYIDAFAGDGTIKLASNSKYDEEDIKGLIKGSAYRALSLDEGFDAYCFIELDEAAADTLRNSLKEDFPQKEIKVFAEDANDVLREICSRDWKKHRAVVFLDPQGAQVEWKTMEALAETKAVDVWIWFPLGVSINRMLIKRGDIPKAWKIRLDKVFGDRGWEQAFYERKTEHTLFGPEERTEKKVDALQVGEYYIKRLKTIFPAVSPNPKVMYNSKNSPIYLLCFAAANPKGGRIALNIANYLLDKM